MGFIFLKRRFPMNFDDGSFNPSSSLAATISQTSSTPIAANSTAIVTVASSANMAAGVILQIIDGANTEYVQVISVPDGTHFQAFFMKDHARQFGGAVAYTIQGTLNTQTAGISGTLSVWGGGTATAVVPAGVATTVIKASPGKLCRAVITAAGTTGDTPIYDNASAGSGTKIGVIPGTTTDATALPGRVFTFDMPALLGITAVGPASSPAFTVSFI
jgi:hypothetical protein